MPLLDLKRLSRELPRLAQFAGPRVVFGLDLRGALFELRFQVAAPFGRLFP